MIFQPEKEERQKGDGGGRFSYFLKINWITFLSYRLLTQSTSTGCFVEHLLNKNYDLELISFSVHSLLGVTFLVCFTT
jgi:hypothetical protein